jgi:serine/threonine protein kinase
MPESPRLIAGQYRLIEQVGRGGFAVVWRAHDERLRREVAAKQLFLPPRFTEEQRHDHRTWTLREARSAARLTHPGVVTVHDVVEHDGIPWIIMEFVPGRTLGELVRTDGPLPPPRAAEIGLQVVEALRAAHAAGVVHRDVKPSNVIVGDRRVVLGDFGIAHVDGDTERTESGIVMGAAAYTAPERARGEPAVAASDLWSLGATLFYAVEGHRPFSGPNANAVFHAILTTDPPPTRRAGPLAQVIDGLLRKDTETRMTAAEASELLSAITAVAPGQEPQNPGLGTTQRLRRRPREPRRTLPTTTTTARMPRHGRSPDATDRTASRAAGGPEATTMHRPDVDLRRDDGPAADDPTEHEAREDPRHEAGKDPASRPRATGPAVNQPVQGEAGRERGLRSSSSRASRRRPVVGVVSLAGIMALLMSSAFGEGDTRRPADALSQPADAGRPLDPASGQGGRTLAAGSAGRSVRLWSVTRRGGSPGPMAFSPDGRVLATGADRRVRLWNTGRYRSPTTVPVPGGPVRAIAFSPDGRTLACAGGALVLLWNLATHSPAATLDTHTRTVEAVTFSPDGRLLATAGEDGTVRLWRLA